MISSVTVAGQPPRGYEAALEELKRELGFGLEFSHEIISPFFGPAPERRSRACTHILYFY